MNTNVPSVLTIAAPPTCEGCGAQFSPTSEHTCPEKPKYWSCWACQDTMTNHTICAFELRALRRENWKECINCPSRELRDGSLMCESCHKHADKHPELIHLNVACARGCGRVGSWQAVCRFCSQQLEEEFENPWAGQTAGCIGCGAEGYDNDFCSSACKRYIN